MAAPWTTADYALIVSIFALTITIGNFVWNIWSKFIFPKPRVEVRLAFVLVPSAGTKDWPKALCLIAVNHGPGSVQLMTGMGRLRRKFPWNRQLDAIFKGYDNWPNDLNSATLGGPGLPKRLDVGETYQMFLLPTPDKYRQMKLFGFFDTFGRTHWATDGSIRSALKDLKNDG